MVLWRTILEQLEGLLEGDTAACRTHHLMRAEVTTKHTDRTARRPQLLPEVVDTLRRAVTAVLRTATHHLLARIRRLHRIPLLPVALLHMLPITPMLTRMRATACRRTVLQVADIRPLMGTDTLRHTTMRTTASIHTPRPTPRHMHNRHTAAEPTGTTIAGMARGMTTTTGGPTPDTTTTAGPRCTSGPAQTGTLTDGEDARSCAHKQPAGPRCTNAPNRQGCL